MRESVEAFIRRGGTVTKLEQSNLPPPTLCERKHPTYYGLRAKGKRQHRERTKNVKK